MVCLVDEAVSRVLARESELCYKADSTIPYYKSNFPRQLCPSVDMILLCYVGHVPVRPQRVVHLVSTFCDVRQEHKF